MQIFQLPLSSIKLSAFPLLFFFFLHVLFYSCFSPSFPTHLSPPPPPTLFTLFFYFASSFPFLLFHLCFSHLFVAVPRQYFTGFRVAIVTTRDFQVLESPCASLFIYKPMYIPSRFLLTIMQRFVRFLPSLSSFANFAAKFFLI